VPGSGNNPSNCFPQLWQGIAPTFCSRLSGLLLIISLDVGLAELRLEGFVELVDLVVVETDDALLVVPRDRAQDVKQVVDALKGRGDKDLV